MKKLENKKFENVSLEGNLIITIEKDSEVYSIKMYKQEFLSFYMIHFMSEYNLDFKEFFKNTSRDLYTSDYQDLYLNSHYINKKLNIISIIEVSIDGMYQIDSDL